MVFLKHLYYGIKSVVLSNVPAEDLAFTYNTFNNIRSIMKTNEIFPYNFTSIGLSFEPDFGMVKNYSNSSSVLRVSIYAFKSPKSGSNFLPLILT